MAFGLILALVVKDDDQPATTITYGEDGKVIVQQPGATQQPAQDGGDDTPKDVDAWYAQTGGETEDST